MMSKDKKSRQVVKIVKCTGVLREMVKLNHRFLSIVCTGFRNVPAESSKDRGLCKHERLPGPASGLQGC